MKKKSKLKSKLLSLLCSAGALSGASTPKSEGFSVMEFISGFNGLSKGLQNMMSVRWYLQNLKKAEEHNSKDRAFPWNPELCPELFEENAAEKYGFSTTFDDAMSLMVGRNKQKEQLRNLSIKHLVNRVMGTRKNVTAVMAYGRSGTGKTDLIDKWERLFIANGFGSSPSTMPHNPAGPCRIRPADIDFSNKKVSFWNQLLESKKLASGNDIPIKSELVAYIEANPNGGIIDIDEADKFMDKSVQEGIRAMIDEGVLRADGVAYPLDNYIIVIKGNMSPGSVFGEDDMLTQNDIQSGLTSIDISQSLTKRMELIPFEPYNAQELFSIFVSRLSEWESKYKDSGLRINILPSTREKVEKYLSNNQMQGRGADKLYKDLTPYLYDIGKKISNNKDNNKFFVYNLLFNEKSQSLYLVENNKSLEDNNQNNLKNNNASSNLNTDQIKKSDLQTSR